MFYIFGGFLVYTAIKLVREHHDAQHPDPREERDGIAVRLFKRLVPTVEEYHGDRLTVRIDGKRFFTPMLVVMVAIGSTDVLFALDSIPAIYGLTEEPYIVFTANAFALLGLRQLYFLIGGLLERLIYLSQGLAVILGFIGIKLVLHALHVNELPFINDGEPVEWAPEIPIWLSLTVILGTLVVATVLSLLKTRNDAPPRPPPRAEDYPLDIDPLVWAVSLGLAGALLVIDVAVVARRPHVPSTAECVRYLAFYIGLAVLFGIGVWLTARRGVRGPVLRRLADGVLAVRRQPVRVPAHHGQVRGAPGRTSRRRCSSGSSWR